MFGSDVGANFQQMMCWLVKGIPLPFGALINLRSLVSLDNVVDLVNACLNHPWAVNQVFRVSDDEDVSTTRLMRCLISNLGVENRLVSLPAGVLVFLAGLLGRRATGQRLLGSLLVDIKKNRELLGQMSWLYRVVGCPVRGGTDFFIGLFRERRSRGRNSDNQLYGRPRTYCRALAFNGPFCHGSLASGLDGWIAAQAAWQARLSVCLPSVCQPFTGYSGRRRDQFALVVAHSIRRYAIWPEFKSWHYSGLCSIGCGSDQVPRLGA